MSNAVLMDQCEGSAVRLILFCCDVCVSACVCVSLCVCQLVCKKWKTASG